MNPLFELKLEIFLLLITLVAVCLMILKFWLKPKQYIPPEIIATLFTAKHIKGDTVFYAKIENSELYICVHNIKVFFSKTVPILEPVWSNIPPPPA